MVESGAEILGLLVAGVSIEELVEAEASIADLFAGGANVLDLFNGSLCWNNKKAGAQGELIVLAL
jgi:hypothetical protein